MEVHIGWASETGNTIDLVKEFLEHCQQQRIRVDCVEQLGKDSELQEGIWIFFLPTTGQGDPPHRMRPLWRKIMSKNYKLAGPILFSVYSLGDTSYGDHFGMAARKLRQRLKMLGGEQFAEIGLGDDMDPQGYRQTYLKIWRNQVTAFLQKQNGASEGELQQIPSEGELQQIPYISLRSPTQQLEYEIESITQLSSHKGRRTYWARLRILGGQAREGEVAEIFPHNRPEDVEWLLHHWQKQGQQRVVWQGNQVSLLELLTEHLNVSSTLNYFFFINKHKAQLAAMTTPQMLQEKLAEFGSSYEEYFNYIKKYRRNIIDFIKDFDLKLDYQYFINHANELTGRKYSIARVEGNHIYLLIKLFQQHITEGRFYRGLCSHDLFRSEGKRRRGKILPGSFLPEQIRPVDLIVTLGTGIAPFLWILDQKEKRDWKCMLVYTNGYSDQMHHRRLVSALESEKYEQISSCTREGGLKIIRLLEGEALRIKNFIQRCKHLQRLRILYCGPKEVHQYLTTFLSQLLGLSLAEITKRKLILFENW